MSPPKVITAVYENGVLRPLEKLDLPENGLFRLTIEPVEEEKFEHIGRFVRLP